MYYILNETNQIIAADDNLLTLCKVTHIDELTLKIAKGDISLALGLDDEMTLTSDLDEEVYNTTQISLSSLLGHLTLVTLATSNEDDLSTPVETENDLFIEEDEIVITPQKEANSEEIDIETEETPNEVISLTDDTSEEIEEEITFENSLSIDDDILEIKTETPFIVEDKIEEEEHDTELFNLLDTSSVTPQEEETPLTTTQEMDNDTFSLDMDDDNDLFIENPKKADIEDIVVDIEEISQKIGISTEDYSHFLNDFIDTALGLEKDLQSQDDEKQSDAVHTLTHLSDVLHLPKIGDIIKSIQTASSNNQRESIELFYSTLSRISTSKEEVSNIADLEEDLLAPLTDKVEDIQEEEDLFAPIEDIVEDTEVAPMIDESPLELFDEPEPIMVKESIQPVKAPSGNSFGTINLDDVQAKHFDFQLEEAANDLSLPVELIEEFVHDFIDQAHIETKKMLAAYEDGDLDAIQKIGHLLKGASSNLRINALSDTLYQIQFCENSNNLEALIKDYWAHFLSFENQINVISN